MTDRNPAWMLTNNCDRTGPRLHRQSQVYRLQTGQQRRRWSCERVQPIEQAAIQQYARQLYLTTVADQFARLARKLCARAVAPELSGSVARAEVEERDRRAVIRRIKEAHFPAVKTLEEFDFPQRRRSPWP